MSQKNKRVYGDNSLYGDNPLDRHLRQRRESPLSRVQESRLVVPLFSPPPHITNDDVKTVSSNVSTYSMLTIGRLKDINAKAKQKLREATKRIQETETMLMVKQSTETTQKNVELLKLQYEEHISDIELLIQNFILEESTRIRNSAHLSPELKIEKLREVITAGETWSTTLLNGLSIEGMLRLKAQIIGLITIHNTPEYRVEDIGVPILPTGPQFIGISRANRISDAVMNVVGENLSSWAAWGGEVFYNLGNKIVSAFTDEHSQSVRSTGTYSVLTSSTEPPPDPQHLQGPEAYRVGTPTSPLSVRSSDFMSLPGSQIESLPGSPVTGPRVESLQASPVLGQLVESLHASPVGNIPMLRVATGSQDSPLNESQLSYIDELQNSLQVNPLQTMKSRTKSRARLDKFLRKTIRNRIAQQELTKRQHEAAINAQNEAAIKAQHKAAIKAQHEAARKIQKVVKSKSRKSKKTGGKKTRKARLSKK